MITNTWLVAILICQILSICLICERVYQLFFKRKLNQKTLAKTIIDQGSWVKALEYARQVAPNNPMGKVAVAGIEAALNNQGKEIIQEKMDEYLLLENSLVEKKTSYLALFANMATLIGLLGTITGLIQSFSGLSNNNPEEKAAILAKGISLAMNTTAYGLIVAVPALIMYAVLQNRASRLTDDLNKGGLNLFIKLGFEYSPTSSPEQGKVLKFENKPKG